MSSIIRDHLGKYVCCFCMHQRLQSLPAILIADASGLLGPHGTLGLHSAARFSPQGLVTLVPQQGGVASLDVWEEGDWRGPEEEGLGARGRGRTSLRLSMPLGSSVHSIDVECPVDVESIIGSSRLVQWWSLLALQL